LLSVTAALVACSSSVDGGPGGSGMTSNGGTGATDDLGAGGGAPPPPPPPGEGDVGTKVIHRLSNTEYNNTVRDLLGTTAQPADGFTVEEAEGFDNIAEALTMSPRHVEDYYRAARTLAEAAFADAAQSAALLSCTPDAADVTCATQIVNEFGLRTFRRPLEQTETDLLVGKYQEALAAGTDALGAMQHVVKIMLAMPQFLYRIEFDTDPNSEEVHALSPYELASRLSYMAYASMPDQALFGLAASGQIFDPATLQAEIDRMLADPKGLSLVTNFARQWFDLEKLETHSVDTTLFPLWTETLGHTMDLEVQAFFSEFLFQDRPYSEFLTADMNFVDAELAGLYGIAAPAEPGLQRVEDATDQRMGFFGLAGFLTHTSRHNRTAPTIRASVVMDSLLCSKLEPPPDLVIAPLPEPDPNAGPQSVRDVLAAHRAEPACAGCHDAIDPVGLALEHFDAVGAYRTEYGPGVPIDAVGTLPDGRSFNGIGELAATLSQDPRFLGCAVTKIFTYALGRPVGVSRSYVDTLAATFATAPTLRNLLKELVVSDPFLFRRGDAP
jgi:hypothetical protein